MPYPNYLQLRKTFEDFLESRASERKEHSLYTPIQYINNTGGKRIRPLLVLMGYQLWKSDVEDALPAALAVEYFHNFSLMHDDIMDEAPLRRGHASVHQKFGRNAGILSGDAMLIISFRLLIEAGEKKNMGQKLVDRMSAVALEICEGQQADMDFEINDIISKEQYIEMIRCKTACLIGFSLEAGALLAGASKEEADALYKFGENLGIAFQIQDDYLDVFGDSVLTGKQESGDILRGKKNFLYVSALDGLSKEHQEIFIADYKSAGKNNDPSAIIKQYRAMNIPDEVMQIEATYMRRAEEELTKISGTDVSPLIDLKEMLIHRDF